MDQSERGPDRMIATQDKTVAGAAQDRGHPRAISIDASSLGVVELSSVDRSPEVGVQLEVCASPIPAHRTEEILKVFLHFRMRSVQGEPRPASPSAEGNLIRRHR